MSIGSRRPTPCPRRGSWATPMAANGALVKARRLTTVCWILLVTETEPIANSLDAPSGAEREGTIPINPIHRGARQGMKCTAQMKLLSPKSRLRLGTWNVRTTYEQGRCAQIVEEMKRYNLYKHSRSELDEVEYLWIVTD